MTDEDYMREALKISEESINGGNSPFAAIIVNKEGEIVGRGHNSVVTDYDPTAHAETNAIRDACKRLKRFWLEECTLYTTNEPCPMCFSMVHWARIKRMVYGQPVSFAAKYGFHEDVATDRKECEMEITGDILKDEIEKLFEKWKAGEHTMY